MPTHYRPAYPAAAVAGSTAAGVRTATVRLLSVILGGPVHGGGSVDVERDVCHTLYHYDPLTSTVGDPLGPVTGGSLQKSLQGGFLEQGTLNVTIPDLAGDFADAGARRAEVATGQQFVLRSKIVAASGAHTFDMGRYYIPDAPCVQWQGVDRVLNLQLEDWMRRVWRLPDLTAPLDTVPVTGWSRLQDVVIATDAALATGGLTAKAYPGSTGAMMVAFVDYLTGLPRPQMVQEETVWGGLPHPVDYPDIVIPSATPGGPPTVIQNKPLTWFNNTIIEPYREPPTYREIASYYNDRWCPMTIAYDGLGRPHINGRRTRIPSGWGWSCTAGVSAGLQIPITLDGGIQPNRHIPQYGRIVYDLYIFWPVPPGGLPTIINGVLTSTQGVAAGTFNVEKRTLGDVRSTARRHVYDPHYHDTQVISVRGDGSKPGLGLGTEELAQIEISLDKLQDYLAAADQVALSVSSDLPPPMLGTEVRLYAPECNYDGYYRLIGVTWPLGTENASWELEWSADGPDTP